MRFPLLLLFTIFTASCTAPAPLGRGATPAAPSSAVSRDAQMCYAQLDQLPGLSYRKLAPRRTAEGCGFDDGVQLLDIGVPVSGITAMSCPVAAAFYRFVNDGLQPAARRHFGQDVVRITSYGTYSCRAINSRPGAKLSQHAYANAIDIAAFQLSDGTTIRVETGWRAGGRTTAFLKYVQKSACDVFQIVIGPDGDRYHQDHLHMDMGRGPYCK
ncbi:MAG: extensin family protein [Pacificimonas sp.]